MHMMNRDGLGITIRHSYLEAVPSIAKYAWRCRRCGHAYERQRRTIRPGRHRCGTCRGPLYEIHPPRFVTAPPRVPARHEPSLLARVADLNRTARLNGSGQLNLTFLTD
jgi:predicted  nucleic acid-binding Zn-ribbon protein